MSIEMCDYITEEAHSKYETDHRQKKSGNNINSCQKSVKNKRGNWK